MKLLDILESYSNEPNVRNRELEAEDKRTMFVLLDTYQDGIYTFTGMSETRQGIERLKDKVIKRFNITKPEELEQLHIFEVPIDEYFDKRAELDVRIRSIDYEEPED